LDELGRRYGQRPSSFLGLPPDSWQAFQFDLATWTVGRWIDGKLAERDKQGHPLHRLQDLLRDAPQGQDTGGFRSLKHMAAKKMTVPASGIW